METRHYYAVFLCVIISIIVCVIIQNSVGMYNKNDADNYVSASKNMESDDNNDKAGKMNSKVAYLTFDDGPSKNTPKVLDILDKYNIKATFFMIGQQINEENKELVKSMSDEGHKIGIHTYCHDYKSIYVNEKTYVEDFNKTKEIIEKVTGISPTIYRFPGGSCNVYIGCIKDKLISGLSEEGYTYYDWNVSGEDSVGHPTTYSIYNNVVKDVCNFDNPIILLHDSAINDNTVNALEDIIKYILEKGYTFGTLSE